MDYKWTLENVKNIFDEINQLLGLSVSCQFEEVESSKFPLCRRNGKIVFSSDFFNHESLTDDDRFMFVIELYACSYLDKHRDGHIYTYPDYLAKAICDLTNHKYIPEHELENSMRNVRQKIYDEPEYFCYYSVGDKVRVDTFTRLEVCKIEKHDDNKVYIHIKPIGYCADKYTGQMVFEEKELYYLANERQIQQPIITKETVVDLRKNIFILSAPSGTGKNSVYELLKTKMPSIRRGITASTRRRRGTESNGIDYYFMTRDEFLNYEKNNQFVEATCYGGDYYGTPLSEIEGHSQEIPVFLLIDVNGRRQVVRKYPLANTIFLLPPSLGELRSRLELRGCNNSESVEMRLSEAEREIEIGKKEYDYIIVNDDLEECTNEVYKIIASKGFVSMEEIKDE